MNVRTVSISILVVTSLGAVLVLMLQQRQLAGLRARKLQFTTETSPSDRPTPSATDDLAALSPPPPELLELRSKVTQLTQRKKDLEGVLHENEQLRVRLAVRATNDFNTLPPGYFRPNQALWLGTDTPENTFQSFLWAIQQRGFTNFLELCTPHFISEVSLPANGSPEEFDKAMNEISSILGIHILNQRTIDPDTIRLDVEYLLRLPNSLSRDRDKVTITFRRTNGQWKQY